MTDGTLTHPTPEKLVAFGAGRLNDEESVAVEEHLTDCVACCESLKHLPGDDSYVGLLREAVSDPGAATILLTPTVAAASADTDGLRDGGTHPRLPVLPRELADHPRYRVIRLLGSGGMGAVYEAEHRLMRRRVALKIIKPEWFRHPEAVARFRREMQAAAKLVHPHVVTAFDAEQAGDLHFLAMEFVDGMTLAELVGQGQRLPVAMACDFVREAALGLQHAHEHGLVHRDIKPGNLMLCRKSAGKPQPPIGEVLDEELSVKILDFGLARFLSESDDRGHQTSAATLLGTPDFMAPEQARDARSADIRSDIYSLGCTLHFLLTGQVPYPGLGSAVEKALAHIDRVAEPLVKFRNDIPLGLQSVLNRMTAKNPVERFATPAEVAVALAPFGTASVSLNRVDDLPAHRPLAAGLQRVLMATGLVGFVLVMAVIVHVVTDKGDLRIRSELTRQRLVLRQNDRDVRVLEVPAGTTTVRLLSGEYELELRPQTTGRRLLEPWFVRVQRGRTSEVSIVSTPDG